MDGNVDIVKVWMYKSQYLIGRVVFLNERLLLLGKWTLSNIMYLFHNSRAAPSTLNRACGWAACRLADIFGHVDIVFQNFLFDTGIKVFLS